MSLHKITQLQLLYAKIYTKMSKNSYFKHSFIIQKHDILMIAIHLSVFRHYENMTIFFSWKERRISSFCFLYEMIKIPWPIEWSVIINIESLKYMGVFLFRLWCIKFRFFHWVSASVRNHWYYKIFIFKIKNSYMITLIKNAFVRCLCSHCENSM